MVYFQSNWNRPAKRFICDTVGSPDLTGVVSFAIAMPIEAFQPHPTASFVYGNTSANLAFCVHYAAILTSASFWTTQTESGQTATRKSGNALATARMTPGNWC